MPKFPIWKFGTRWAALVDYRFSPEENRPIPAVASPPSSANSSSSARDAAANSLIAADVAVLAVLVFRLHVTKAAPFVDLFRMPENFAVICYLFVLGLYSIYLGMYYRVIWSQYYGLSEERPSDSGYFLYYSFFIAVVSIIGMFLYPLGWPIYISLIFVPVAFKKFETMRLFCDAADDYLKHTRPEEDVQAIVIMPDPHSKYVWICQIVAARQLSISFTRNFIVWGLVFGAGSLCVLVFNVTYSGDSAIFGAEQVLSLVLVVFVGFFFLVKTSAGGIKNIRDQVEKGEWSSFTLVRRPWS